MILLMLQYIFRQLFFVFLFFHQGFLFAQLENQDVDTTKAKFKFYEVKVGTNVQRLGMSAFSQGVKNTYEFTLVGTLNKLDLNLEYGHENTRRSKHFLYNNRGDFFRVGIDRNFAKNSFSGNVYSLGLRYGIANFKEDIKYDILQILGNPVSKMLNVQEKTARWIELVLNVRGRIVSNLYMGFSLRYKMSRTVSGESLLEGIEIPGYGNILRKHVFGLDYYLVWRIPFRKID